MSTSAPSPIRQPTSEAAATFWKIPTAWLPTFGSIVNKRGEIERPRVNILQRRINSYYLSCFTEQRPCRGIGVKPRKKGFSTAVAGVHYPQLMMHRHHGVVVGHFKETSSESIYNMMAHYASHDDFYENWGSRPNITGTMIEWEHGSKFERATAENPQSLRSMTLQAIHFTEAAFYKRSKEVLQAGLNAMPDSVFTSCWLESTPYGQSGAFPENFFSARWPMGRECPDSRLYWKQWESALPDVDQTGIVSDDELFVRIFAAWYEFEDAGIELSTAQQQKIKDTLDREEAYAGERLLIKTYANEGPQGPRLGWEQEKYNIWEQLAWRRMTIRTKCNRSSIIFDEEYPRDPHSAFQASGSPVFDLEAIAHVDLTVRRSPPVRLGALNPVERRLERGGIITADASWEDVEPMDAIFQKWEDPIPGCRYILPVDPMRGEAEDDDEDPDRHSALVLRQPYRDEMHVFHNCAVVARIKSPCQVPVYVLSEWVHLLHLHYQALVAPEANAHGLALIDRLRDLGTMIYRRKRHNPKTGKAEASAKWGWETGSSDSFGRTTILEELHQVLREEAIDIFCPNIAHELRSFVRNHKKRRWEAGSGAKDDDVMALAIGIYLIRSASVYTPVSIIRRSGLGSGDRYKPYAQMS